MAFPTGMAQEQLRALDLLKDVPGIGGFYLVGGGAIAFHLAEGEAVLPAGLSEALWDEIKCYFLQSAPALLEEGDLEADDE